MPQWRLDDGRQTLVMAAEGDALPAVIYFGTALPRDEDLEELARAQAMDLGGGTLDVVAPISLCPEPGRGFGGHPGAMLRDSDGLPLTLAFEGARVEATDTAFRVTARNRGVGLRYNAVIEILPTGLVALRADLDADAPVICDWLAAPVLPGPQDAAPMIDIHGGWISEWRAVETPWQPGQRVRDGRQGRSGHEHPPHAVFPARGTTKTRGQALALHYAWSGGHRMVAEELPDGRRQLQMGHSPGAWQGAATRFSTGTLLAGFSTEGMGGTGVLFQRHIRDMGINWPDKSRPRPVHYNCWEAIYFDHSLDALKDIASAAADLGAERFVLDDGWFGQRDDDTTSLGDWWIDTRKYPDGLMPLIEHVHACGMAFGLWVEPEMVNENSDLYRLHPGWVLGPPDQPRGRQQLVLDLGRADVRDHLFDALHAILKDHPVDYLKWDHNRLLPIGDAAQTDGIYALLDRLRAAHPGVEIESCASGGGRIDAGILSRTHRVWLSDSNDALERVRIQHAASLLLPSAVTGSHVGPDPSHTSGRRLPMAFRAWVAAQRHMGFEMDPRSLPAEDAETLRGITKWYKDNRVWMHAGDILPLDCADPAVRAELQRAADGHRFVAFVAQTETSPQALPRPLRLAGLDPEARYRVRLVNPSDIPPQSRGPVALKDGPVTLSGTALMGMGLSLPWAWPATMWVIEGERL
ncbi:alpha-galactosidase [Palleronia pelagia]|uniref:alpha-galactosidase n=1 Tax=Palleronia pelagia TaxID=387096 RepID=A0A1H8H7A1_9RHOB|nr:alpha-galactosidase [Palleronia pelagia]SEN52231.1 alpha-galactosidase [Palleronia pelagia]